MNYTGEWMFEQVKTTAGLAMSTFKDKGDNVSDEAGLTEEEIEENVIQSNWSPPPHLAKQWATGAKAVSE